MSSRTERFWRGAACLASFLGTLPAAAAPEIPDADLLQNADARAGISLDGDWHVIVDPYENGYYNHRYEPRPDGFFLAQEPSGPADLVEYDFRRSPVLAVPGDWNSQAERFFLYEGAMWYYTTFELDPDPDRHYRVHFGAANYTARVWLNGELLGAHEGGFTPFEFAADEFLRDGENFVVVMVNNRRERNQVPTVNTDWWNYGGLTRSVRLIDVPRRHVADWRLHLDADGRIAGWVRVAGAGGGPVRIAIPALGIDTTIDADEAGIATVSLDAKPERWQPGKPVLYEVEFGYAGDRVRDRIGFRTIAVRSEDLLLNGEPIFLRGISIHEEAPDRAGRAWSEADARALLGWALELGCNFVRLAHYPHNEHMLRVADELGLLVWAEIPVYWTIDFESPAVYQKAEQQLDEMIARDANRASVILWSMANETPQSDARFEFINSLARHARALDPTRLITAALDTQTADRYQRTIDDPLASVIDVIGINSYCGWYGDDRPADCAQLRWRSDYGKPIILSEMGADALAGHHGAAAVRWTEEYQSDVYRHNLEMAAHIQALRGLSPWILKDFRSPRRPLPGIQDYWNRKGLLSETGVRKAAWSVLQEEYRRRAAGD